MASFGQNASINTHTSLGSVVCQPSSHSCPSSKTYFQNLTYYIPLPNLLHSSINWDKTGKIGRYGGFNQIMYIEHV